MTLRRGICFELARVTIEFSAPFLIGAGGGDLVSDAVGVRDANGLPTLPGSSLAGVLRHALAEDGDPDRDADCRRAFGYQDRAGGESSLVELSWGQVHGQDDRPVPFIGASADPITAFLASGVVRDHVRIDGHGVADDRGRFDLTAVPAGARFTFELLVHDGSPIGLERLLALLASPAVRLGGHTRSGLGAFEVVRALGRRFDLRKQSDRAAWAKLPRALAAPIPRAAGLVKIDVSPQKPPGVAVGALSLRAEDFWIVGRGEPILSEHFTARDHDKPHDQVPVTERRIVWSGGEGKLERRHLLAGSGVKGVLRHRTSYHARRLAGLFAGDAAATTEPEAVRLLFGEVRTADEGRPGRVFVEDSWLSEAQYGSMPHVSIDRFTGGPLDGCLFSEALLWKGELALRIAVDGRQPAAKERRPFELGLRGLRCAIADLCEGRLALGAGANRGHGYMRGSCSGLEHLGGRS